MVRVAVVGCAHGMLDDIYATVKFINEMDAARPVQLLLCCGDFECMRNERDLEALACPPKYREMHAFHQFYKGEKVAPVLTIFVGGNHEASNYLQELHYGGWVAPNIFYLGSAGVVNVGGLRIGGLSGIYKHQDYTAGRFERAPFDNSTMRSVYHVRELEVYQLSHVQQRVPDKLNVFLSHDWPRGIEQFGDLQMLLRRKPFFAQEVQSNSLGSPAGEFLMYQLKPEYWFAAHLHVKFAAIVRHQESTDAATIEEEKGEQASTDASAPSPAVKRESTTKFLALDKCLPRREFLQVLDIPAVGSEPASAPTSEQEKADEPLKIMFDPEWLAVLRATHHLASTNKYGPRVPQEEMVIEQRDIDWVNQRLQEFWQEKRIENKVQGEWVTEFVKTVPAYGEPAAPHGHAVSGNPQTDLLLELLKLPHVVTAPFSGATAPAVEDPNEIDLDDDLDDEDAKEVTPMDQEGSESTADAAGVASMQIQEQSTMETDPNEIDLDE